MGTFKYVNAKGDEVDLSTLPPFILSKIDGLGDVDGNIQTRKGPNQDGESFVSVQLGARFIDMEVSILGSVESLRRNFAKIFNPKIPGMLIYEENGLKRYVNAQSEHVPKFPSGRSTQFQLAKVSLKCVNPFWMDYEGTSTTISNGHIKEINNLGDVDTPVKIVISGPAQNVILKNTTTNEVLKINKKINNGESLVVTTGFGEKRVELDGVSAFHYLDVTSVLWSLVTDTNRIECSYTGTGSAVEITYSNRYLSI